MNASRARRLLFTGGGGAGSEALYRLLSDRYDVHFADADPDAKPAGVPAVAWHQLPHASAHDFLEGVARLCRALEIELLVPGVDEELLPVSRARAVLGCEVLLPPTAFVEAHLDKLASHILLQSLGTAVPDTELLPDRRRVLFPCVVKPRQGRGSRHVAVVASEEELLAHVVACRRAPDEFIVQQLLKGQEYTVTVVADRTGGLRAVVPIKVALKRGITLRAETDHDEQVMRVCEAIHAASPVPGCFNVQLIKAASGDVRPFEVNPRISTTMCLALAAGVHVIDLYLRGVGASGPPPSGLAPFANRLKLRRSWYNEFSA